MTEIFRLRSEKSQMLVSGGFCKSHRSMADTPNTYDGVLSVKSRELVIALFWVGFFFVVVFLVVVVVLFVFVFGFCCCCCLVFFTLLCCQQARCLLIFSFRYKYPPSPSTPRPPPPNLSPRLSSSQTRHC